MILSVVTGFDFAVKGFVLYSTAFVIWVDHIIYYVVFLYLVSLQANIFFLEDVLCLYEKWC